MGKFTERIGSYLRSEPGDKAQSQEPVKNLSAREGSEQPTQSMRAQLEKLNARILDLSNRSSGFSERSTPDDRAILERLVEEKQDLEKQIRGESY